MNVQITTVIAVLTALGGAYAYETQREGKEHERIEAQLASSVVEIDLQRVELELKLLRTIQERRPLTPDEQDRYEYLKQLRALYKSKQKKGG